MLKCLAILLFQVLRSHYASESTTFWGVKMLSFTLLMLAGLAMIVFGFRRLIVGLRQVKQFAQRSKSKNMQR